MKALSIRSPWWWFVLHSGKDIENRDWYTSYRGKVLIHASKWWGVREVREDFDIAVGCVEMKENCIFTAEFDEPNLQNDTLAQIRARCGCIVGSVEIVDCVGHSSSPWFFGKYGFVLRNPIAFDNPFPVKGSLGFFDVEYPKGGNSSSAPPLFAYSQEPRTES